MYFRIIYININKNIVEEKANSMNSNSPLKNITKEDNSISKEEDFFEKEGTSLTFTLDEFEIFMSSFVNLKGMIKEANIKQCRVENTYSFEVPKKDIFLHKLRKRNSYTSKFQTQSKTVAIDTIKEFKDKLIQAGTINIYKR